MAIVYIHRRKDIEDPFLNVFYVGIALNDKRRPYEKYKRNSYWKRIVEKFGYEIEITHRNIIWEEACAIERYLVSFYGRHDLNLGNLANMTDGGDGRINHIKSKEEIEKHRIAMMGERNPMYGKISPNRGKKGFFSGHKHSEEAKLKLRSYRHTEEAKKRMSESTKGFKHSMESKQKMSLVRTGEKRSEEVRKKLSEAKKGEKNPNYGKRGKDNPRFGVKFSEEKKQRLKENRLKNPIPHPMLGKVHKEETKNKMKIAWVKRKQKKYENSLFDASHFNGGNASVCIEKNTSNS
jgi:hypothetical protein